jgi:3-hydroxyacyl-CoA dehydrogenase
MAQLVTITKERSVGLIALNSPPVNALAHPLRAELQEALAQALGDPELGALVLYCEGRTFIAGADIGELGKEPRKPDVTDVVEFVGAAEKPVVVAMHGTALGGGLELALACHFRLATGNAKLGFPEVGLGILPGGGGTQRLPRLIGVRRALELVVGGAPISAAQAFEWGLLDEVIQGDVRTAGLAFAERLLREGTPLRRASERTAVLEEPGLFDACEARIRETQRGFIAPLRCVQAIRGAVELPFDQGIALERALFRELVASSQSKAQRHVFFAEREVSRLPGPADKAPLREVKSVAVIGAGSLGAGIATCFADARIAVTVLDPSRERGLACEEAKNADLVVEAVGEDLRLKRELFALLDTVCKPGAMLATTTSSLDIDRIAEDTERAGDVVGMHFGTPVQAVKLLEIARARRTTPDVWASALKVGKALGKISVPVIAHPGLAADRMRAQELREALFLLEEGALPAQVDRVLRDFGFPLGPFAALDAAGLESAWRYRQQNYERMTLRERSCDLLEKVYALGRLGRQTQAGFHRYGAGGEPSPDPAIEELVVNHSHSRGVARRSVSDAEILERCLYAIINEGANVLAEGVVARALDVDMVWIHGFGFPTYRGGPLFHADELGLPHVQRTLLALQARLGAEYWAPAPLIERLIQEGKCFYGAAPSAPAAA